MNPSLLRQSAVRMGTLLRPELGENFGERLLDLVDDRLAIAAAIALPAGLASAEGLVALLGALARHRHAEAAAAVAHRIYAAALLADVDEQIAVEAGARAWLGPDAPPATKEDVWPL